jgi:hypothetical protein
MLEKAHIEEAAQCKLRAPEPAIEGPVGVGEVRRSPTPPHLHDGNGISFFYESMSGDAATESRSDDDEVKVKIPVAVHKGSFPLRKPSAIEGTTLIRKTVLVNRMLARNPLPKWKLRLHCRSKKVSICDVSAMVDNELMLLIPPNPDLQNLPARTP